MELRQVRYFVMVAQELHFGRAAERLHIVQSAVSQQVRRLERELKAELFDRSARQVRLTPLGERFLPEAQALLAAEERARAVVADLAATRAGVLRVGTSTGMGAHLDRMLEALAQLAPGTGVELVAAPAPERLEQVAAGELDAAFVRGDADDGGPAHARTTRGDGREALSFVPLWQDPLVAAVPARHALAASPGTIALADLAEVPLILTERRTNRPLVDLVLAACHDAGFTPVPGPRPGTLDNTLAAIGACGPADALWTVVYAAHAERLSTPRVAYLPFRNPGMELTTYLAVHRTDPSPASGRGYPRPGVELLLRACAAATDLDR
ncbi:LysR family transcriptional regulator [Streptomyces natalensis]|uniref:LysR family transcriptional regulator n=1 Tax=Streptomyces natalensis ATCC 27448 TaxID=1240678 RepID=A0A0D7CHA8_9ACTN|nr:LysR family transcriptional regulator [Streptomyces natalensis]KIZ15593.1 LysR family transcriptional regulator [Streptomyces natalensis ATCC 27448]